MPGRPHRGNQLAGATILALATSRVETRWRALPPEVRDDLVGETAVRVLAWHRRRGAARSIRAFVYAVLDRLVADHFTARRREREALRRLRAELEQQSCDPEGERRLLDRRLDALERCLRTGLAEPDRALLLAPRGRVVAEELARMAAARGVPVAALGERERKRAENRVHQRMRRARQRLRRAIEEALGCEQPSGKCAHGPPDRGPYSTAKTTPGTSLSHP